MSKINELFIIFAFLFLTVSLLTAQDAPEFSYRIGGTIQPWFSYGQVSGSDTNSLGFGIRRARLRAYSQFGDKMKGFIQMELVNPKLLDARIDYLISKSFTIRAGRFIGAGVRAGGLTSHTSIDITERPLTAVSWGLRTISTDFRDYGMDVVGQFGDIKANITLHNGNGAGNILSRQTGPGLRNSGLAISGMLVYKPKTLKGLEAGGYYGMGNTEINDYNAYNAYIYYEPKPLRVKAEVIGWTNNASTSADADISRLGYYLFAGYGFAENWEAVARYETYDENTDVDKNELTLLTVGATYSIFETKWTAGKITAAYVFQYEGEALDKIDNNILRVVMQLVF